MKTKYVFNPITGKFDIVWDFRDDISPNTSGTSGTSGVGTSGTSGSSGSSGTSGTSGSGSSGTSGTSGDDMNAIAYAVALG